MIAHIVFFKLNDPTDANIAEAKAMLLGMAGNIPLLRHLEVGTDVVRSERSYDLALVTKFDSLEDLRAYQVHPYHADTIVPYVKSVSKSVVTVDYEAG
ncbi:MAG TPA: Dabb family protein [Geobacteraceae bacterium]|nr:Dabb family protein [Geobacteraceae bacterium]